MQLIVKFEETFQNKGVVGTEKRTVCSLWFGANIIFLLFQYLRAAYNEVGFTIA